MKKQNYKRIIFLLSTLVCMILIFKLSSHDKETTNNLSKGFTEYVAKFLFFNYEKFSDDLQFKIIIELNKFVRKLAHFTIYFILGFSNFLFIKSFNISLYKKFFYSFIFCMFYAMTDEFHQKFTGRTAMIKDVIIDCFGSSLGIVSSLLCVIIYNYYLIYKKGKLQNIL